MLKEVTREIEMCDVCGEREKSYECNYCGIDLCRECQQRMSIRYDDEHRGQRILCEKCKTNVYGAYFEKLAVIEDYKVILQKQIKEANQLLTDINKKTH